MKFGLKHLFLVHKIPIAFFICQRCKYFLGMILTFLKLRPLNRSEFFVKNSKLSHVSSSENYCNRSVFSVKMFCIHDLLLKKIVGFRISKKNFLKFAC